MSSIDKKLWINDELCFARLPELDFMHLKFTYDEAEEYLKGFEKLRGHTEAVLSQAYSSHVINRKMFCEHIEEIFNSRFNEYAIDYWSIDREPNIEELLLIKRRYGVQRFDIRGIALTAVK